jgi:Tol biopolymer transport system component
MAAAGSAALLAPMTPARAQRYFGQNQVEYRHFRWRVLETEHFKIYYYPEEKVPLTDAARMAERSYTRLSRVLGHQFREKKPILLFASRQDFGQNNITGDLGEGVGGVTDASRQRMILPFTGDYESFQHVLTHEMVHQFQYDVFSHGRAGEDLQTLEQVNPPGWFMEGMAEYLSLGPNHPLTTMWIRDAVVNGNLPTIKQMTDDPDRYFPYRYGEALWRYVGERWGDAAIGEILESVTTAGIDRGFQREIGLTLDQLSDQWRESTRQEYLPKLANTQRVRDFATPLLTPKITGGNIFLSPVLSPDGKTIAFLSNGSVRKGEVFIDLYLGDARTGKRIKRLVETTTNPKFEELRLLYSQGGFSPDGSHFAFTAQTGGRDVLSIVDVHTGKVKQLTDIPLDGVLNPAYSPDGKQIVFEGLSQGVTDLYVSDTDGKNLRHLTQDRYGDLQPAWSPDGTRIAFASDRGTTNLSTLDLGKMQITILDVRDGSIHVLPGQTGMNINPVWSPDGTAIAYVSDRGGTQNIYVHDLRTDTDLRMTNVQGGVSSFTEESPAITWSRGTDRLAFTYFDNNDFTVWQLENPRAFAAAQPQPGAQPTSAVATTTTPSTTTNNGVTSSELMPAGTPVADSTPGRANASSGAVSAYRSATGARPSGAIPERESVDSTAISSVASMLADPISGLPDTLTFKEYPYHVSFEPDYISGGTVGVSTGGGFGTQYGGGTTLVFGDLTGDHQIAVGGGVSGRIQDASFLFDYLNMSHRWQYLTGISQDVAYLGLGVDPQTDQNGNLTRLSYVYERYVFRTATFSTAYPFDRFTRVEFGVQASAIGRGLVMQNYDVAGNTVYNVSMSNGENLGTLSFVSPLVAFVSDNSLWGLTGPISGRRMRFSVSPSLGNIRIVNYLADYRRYDPVIFNTLTFATRALFTAYTGRDAWQFEQYVGSPDLVRGYDQMSFYGGYSCQSYLGSTANAYGNACTTPQLAGTHALVLNEELRFPIIRRFDLGSFPIGLPPVDGAIFYDAGLAWNPGQAVRLARPGGFDPNTSPDTVRYFMRSYGASIRLNLFNLAVLRWDVARPLDRPNYRRFNWTFSIGANY